MKEFLARIRFHVCTPRGWHFSQAVSLDKQNGKVGPIAVRLIQLMCPFGKQWYKMLWDAGPDASIPLFAHGGVKGRRRESANAFSQIVACRSRKAGLMLHDSFIAFQTLFAALASRI